MPIVEANGKEFEFPDGTSEQDIGAALDEYFSGSISSSPANSDVPTDEALAIPAPGSGKKSVDDFSVMENIQAAPETALSFISGGTTGMLTGAVGGLAGAIGDLAGILTPEEAQELQQRAASIGTYEPRQEAAKAQVEALGELTESLPPVMGANVPRVRIGPEGKVKGLTGQAAQAEKLAQQKGLPLYESDVNPPTTFAGKAIRGLGEKVPLFGTGGKRAAQQEARQGLISDFLSEAGDVSERDLFNSLKRSNEKRAEAMGNKYQDIQNRMGEDTVPPTNTISAIDAEIERLQQPGKVQDPDLVKKLETLKSDLESGEQDYRGMRENRTLVREKLKSDMGTSTLESRAIDRVYNAMTQDIQSSVSGKLGKKDAANLRKLDKDLYDQINETKKTKLKNVLQKGDVKPEEVSKMMLSNDPSEARQLYKALDKQGRENARGFFLNKLRDFYEESESPEKFLSRVNKYKRQVETFFPGSKGEDFNNLLSYLKQTKQASSAGVYNKNGQELIGFLTYAAPSLDAATLASGGTPVATATAASLGLMARAMENRKIRVGLRKLRTLRPYTPEYNQTLIAIDNAVNDLNQEQQR